MNFPPEVKFGYFSFIMNFPHDLHVFEVNTDMVQQFEDAGLSFTGKDESGRRMEVYVSIGIGTCYVKVDDNGMQIVVIEYARSILGLLDVNSTEFDPNTNNPWVNPDTVQQFKDAGLSFIGKDESGCRMEFTPSLNLTLFPPGICCYRLETCYVKVDDDGSSEVVLSFEGSGVSQDGLVLMGKR
ncbi:hypothetical protein KY285_004073 [Solanum tuberosum]|nr:hypothetical protein KY285_004073 [Solanum tuberosum]